MAVTSKSEPESGQRAVITGVAIDLFGKQGFTGTSMRDIAKAVGLLPGSLYAHIESKEALLLSIVADGIGRFIAAVEPCLAAPGTPVERLRAMISAHVEVVADNPERSQVVFHQWRFLAADNLPEAIKQRQHYESLFNRVISEGLQEREFKPNLSRRIVVLTILGALNWTPEWFDPHGALSGAEIGSLMADALLSGILA